MQTIRELLNQIRWDPNYSKSEFEIEYLDHLEDHLIRVPFKTLYLEPEHHFFFQFIDAEGIGHSVPLHRIKSVYKDGELIWHREH
jgi:uncharacterized protein (UPF0248 family)